jgi:hypothetical protein
MLLLAAFSRHEAALDWARRQAEAALGPIALVSEAFAFTETQYYTATMGSPLRKRFFALEQLIEPQRLATIKRMTNDWEREYAEQAADAEARPLNLDPGYLDLAKLVLASTKDHAHRIYLQDGIYAEVTLQYRVRGGWQPQPWTFPDYRRADYHEFFDRCRQELQRRLKTTL